MSTLDLIYALLKGLEVTLVLTVLSMILGFVLAFVAGLGRLSKYKIVRTISAIYVEVIRGTSLLVQLFWIYFALPILGIRLPAMAAGILALGLNSGAYGSEIVRSSILSVPEGQNEAGIALNMTRFQRMWRIIMPQAFVMMLPGFGNLQIELLKGTALVSLITLADLTYQANVLNASTLETTKIFGILLIMYYLIAWPMTKGIRWLENRLTVGRY
ncbi:ectoine/hydroxyectoine ABC transporter permease subunit EhuC [Schnuerera sp. xch1]|uniref:ectoine/hydroxyectoine ABC transporter permease subunit EhuC n=1 Tax=Schnuerera sp. xch1 TaxID=2874283 RepID=UPI001CBE9C54|nr:ectoine/hydroxyectoine ABC transporter permease subunit EhuC [Schnuerera sp. xch1]MBZ2175461.1 ectoine/hydroxyectoine ABC transporter permease subunit EhuC [Schnuerera sp. xch1]